MIKAPSVLWSLFPTIYTQVSRRKLHSRASEPVYFPFHLGFVGYRTVLYVNRLIDIEMPGTVA